MGNKNDDAEDFEITVLIDKCSVCHINMDSSGDGDHNKLCSKRNGNVSNGEFELRSCT